MVYTLVVDIALPRAKVVGLFDNPAKWPEWQDGFIRSETLEGPRGVKGQKPSLFTSSVGVKLK